MSDDEVAVYVLPTETGLPPRALIGRVTDDGIEGQLATWSRDSGTWTVGGLPIPQEVAERITEHARSLGVEEFLD
jgi:hypothetical protein